MRRNCCSRCGGDKLPGRGQQFCAQCARDRSARYTALGRRTVCCAKCRLEGQIGPIGKHARRCFTTLAELYEVGERLGVLTRTDHGCVEWQFQDGRRRHGNTAKRPVLRGRRLTHWVLEFDGRPLLPGQIACHTCDNVACIEPSHLWGGTQGENSRDMWAKGRGRNQHSV